MEFRNIDYWRPPKKQMRLINKIEVGNIIELNDLVYAGTVVVTEMLGVKNRKSTGLWNHGGKGEWKRK